MSKRNAREIAMLVEMMNNALERIMLIYSGHNSKNGPLIEDAQSKGNEDVTLIKNEYKKKYASLFEHLSQIFLNHKNALSPLPKFEEVVGQKKKNGEPTKDVQTEREEFLKRY